MIKKRKYKKKFTTLGSLLIFVSLSIFVSYYTYNYIYYKYNEQLVENYFISKVDKIKNKEITKSKTVTNYIGILEIPKINLKKGFLNLNDKNNNVNKNIQVLKNSNMPNIENSFLAIAGHSGNGIHSYFKDIDKLNINDEIYVYYENIKYVYIVNDIYEVNKTGYIEIQKNDISTLILTTCSEKNKNKQLIVESILKTTI